MPGDARTHDTAANYGDLAHGTPPRIHSTAERRQAPVSCGLSPVWPTPWSALCQSHSKPEAARYNDLQRRQNGALPPTSRARARQPGPATPAWTSVDARPPAADMVEPRGREVQAGDESTRAGETGQ